MSKSIRQSRINPRRAVYDRPSRGLFSIDDLVIKFLRENGGYSHRQPIKDYLYETAGYIGMRGSTRKLVQKGILINPRPGHYALAPEARDTDDTPPTTATAPTSLP